MNRSVRLGTWRLFAALAMLLVSACLVAACGGDDDSNDSQPSGAAADGEVEGKLTFWYSPSESTLGPWWDKFAADFEKRHPKAELEVTRYSTEEYITKVQSAFAAGDEPDLFEASGPGEELHKFVRVGKIADVREVGSLDSYQPAAVAQYANGPDGETYAAPRSKYFLNVWYNEDLFAERDLAVPKTWDELITACEELSADDIIPIALGVGGQDQWTASHLYDTLLYQYGGADYAFDATYGNDDKKWTDEPIVEAATRFEEMREAGCFPPGVAGLNYAQMSSLFLRGDAATIFTGTWFGAQVQAGAGDFEVGVFPLPDGPGATHSTADLEGIVGGVAGLAASKRAADRNPALLAAFYELMGEYADAYANDNGVVSVAADPKPKGGKLQKELAKLGDSVDEVGPVTDVVTPPSIVDDYYPNLQSLASGDLSPQEFADAMEEAVAAERPGLPEPVSN
jgi:raffinose/stachyose/melibiose transport system substrate-binding protein